MIIKHNISGMKVINQSVKNQRNMGKNIARLSSGLRINKAADDVAGLAISEKLKGKTRALKQAQRNIMDGIGLIQTTEGGINEIQNMLTRINELSVQAANGTLTADDRSNIQLEIDELKKQIDQIANDTHFNKINTLAPPKGEEIKEGKTVDITFAIDATGSMHKYASKVADNLEGFIDSIKQKNAGDVRVSIIAYYDDEIKEYDFNAGDWVSVVSGTTPQERWQSVDQMSSIANALKHLPSHGGVENNMKALEYAAEHIDYREDQSTKHIILLTDEIGDDNSQTSSVTDKLKEKDITVHSIYNKGVLNDKNEGVHTVAGATGGIGLDITSGSWSDDLNRQIGGAIGDSAATDEKGYSEVVLQVGDQEKHKRIINLYYMRTKDLKIEDLSVETEEKAQEAISRIKGAIDIAGMRRSYLGAQQNRLEHVNNYTGVTDENETAALSRIEDMDMAEGMAEFTKDSILEQTSTAMMTQANQQVQLVLQLLD